MRPSADCRPGAHLGLTRRDQVRLAAAPPHSRRVPPPRGLGRRGSPAPGGDATPAAERDRTAPAADPADDRPRRGRNGARARVRTVAPWRTPGTVTGPGGWRPARPPGGGPRPPPPARAA